MKRYALFALILLLAACGSEEVLPTPTPDPLAFFAPTPFSPGTQQNPLQVVFVPPNPEAIDQSATILRNELRSRSGLAVEVVTVPSYGEALAMLCDYNDDDRFVAPWLSGPAAVMAVARGCGDVAMQATRAGSPTLAGEIVSRTGVSLNGLPGQTFCRLSVGDFYSWVLPSLAMQARNIDPTRLSDVEENYADYNAMFEAVIDGNCVATGIPAGLLDDEAYEEYRPSLRVGFTTMPMPYGVLVYPPELLLADREALTQAFLAVAGDSAAVTEEAAPNANATPSAERAQLDPNELTTNQLALVALLDADGVIPASFADLAEVQAFMSETGIDLAGLGR